DQVDCLKRTYPGHKDGVAFLQEVMQSCDCHVQPIAVLYVQADELFKKLDVELGEILANQEIESVMQLSCESNSHFAAFACSRRGSSVESALRSLEMALSSKDVTRVQGKTTVGLANHCTSSSDFGLTVFSKKAEEEVQPLRRLTKYPK